MPLYVLTISQPFAGRQELDTWTAETNLNPLRPAIRCWLMIPFPITRKDMFGSCTPKAQQHAMWPTCICRVHWMQSWEPLKVHSIQLNRNDPCLWSLPTKQGQLFWHKPKRGRSEITGLTSGMTSETEVRSSLEGACPQLQDSIDITSSHGNREICLHSRSQWPKSDHWWSSEGQLKQSRVIGFWALNDSNRIGAAIHNALIGAKPDNITSNSLQLTS